MNWWFVSYRQIVQKKLSSFLSVLLMAFGVGIISLMLLVQEQVNETFKNNIRGVDLVVGAKGSPLQIILSSVYHMDSPTGNIKATDAQKIAKHNLVKLAVPLSFGDSYSGYRIVGTTHDYLELYDAQILEGSFYDHTMEVVLGATAAKALGLNIGDTFEGNHGLQTESFETHVGHGYNVVGILKPSHSVVDQLILTSLNSVWDVHAHKGEEEHHKHVIENVSDLDSNAEITSMLLKFKSPMAAFSLPAYINQKTQMQAALPAIEVNRLMGLLGIGIETLKNLAFFIVIISAISVFISLLTNLKEHRYEMALIRSMGASRITLFRIIIQQGVILALLGFIVGNLFSKLALFFINAYADAHYHLSANFISFSKFDMYLLILSLGIGFVSAVIPAINAYKLNISKVLSHA